MTETWLPVIGYQGYEISDQGRVKSYRKATQGGRLMKAPPDSDGYPSVGLYDSPQCRKTTKVATIVALAFLGSRPEGMVVRHLNGERSDSSLKNLCYGTIAENVADEVAHGTHWNSSKDSCPQGHPYVEGNIYRRKTKNSRECRQCCQVRSRDNYWRSRLS